MYSKSQARSRPRAFVARGARVVRGTWVALLALGACTSSSPAVEQRAVIEAARRAGAAEGIGRVEDENVVTLAAGGGVATPDKERVVARTAEEHIGPVIAVERISAIAAEEHVVAGIAKAAVVAVLAEQPVGAVAGAWALEHNEFKIDLVQGVLRDELQRLAG